MTASTGLRIATRAFIEQDDSLLFVSHDNVHWYLPGGRPESHESLRKCVEREVYEETGLSVKTQDLAHVLECSDAQDGRHKIIFYFRVKHVAGILTDDWKDIGEHVQYRRFFSMNDIRNNPKILPRFLVEQNWQNGSVYKGHVKMHGFSMLEPEPVHA